jgi:hypothetical protein
MAVQVDVLIKNLNDTHDDDNGPLFRIQLALNVRCL